MLLAFSVRFRYTKKNYKTMKSADWSRKGGVSFLKKELTVLVLEGMFRKDVRSSVGNERGSACQQGGWTAEMEFL